MKQLALMISVFLSFSVYGQLSVQESDGNNKLKIVGKEWSSNFFSLAGIETNKFNDEGGRLSTYNYFSFSTYANSNYRFSLRLPFQYNTAGTDRFNGRKVNDPDIFLQDVILSLQDYSLVAMPLDLNLYWEGRTYLPTSEFSRKTDLITRLRNHFVLSRVFNRYFEAEYDQKFSYYFQSRTLYQNNFEDENGFQVSAKSLTKQSEWEHTLRVWGKFTPEVGLGWNVGWTDATWNKSKAEQRSRPQEKLMATGPVVRFPLTRNANLMLSYEDQVNRDENPGELGQFLAKNTNWTLLSFIKF